MDLIAFIRILIRRKWLLIILPAASVIFTFFLTKNLPQIYRSEAQLATGLTDGSKISITTDETRQNEIQQQFVNLMELARSKTMIDLLGYRLMVHDLTAQKPFRPLSKLILLLSAEERDSLLAEMKMRVDSLEGLYAGFPYERRLREFTASMEYDEAGLEKKIIVSRVEMSDYVRIGYESENPELSTFVVNTLCSEFIQYYKDMKKKRANETASTYWTLAAKKKQEVDEKVGLLKQYKIANKIINLQEQTRGVDGQIIHMEMAREDVNQKIPALTAAINDINSRFTSQDQRTLEAEMKPYAQEINFHTGRVKLFTSRNLTAGTASPAIADSLRSAEADLDAVLRKASDKFTINPNISWQELAGKKISFEIDRDIAENTVKSIDMELKRLQKKFDTFIPHEATVGALERDVDVAEKTYLTILQRFNEASLNTNVTATLSQTQFGEPGPPQPSKRFLLIFLSGVITFVLSVVSIFVLEYLDLTLKTPKKFVQLTGIPLLAGLNFVNQKLVDLISVFSSPDTDDDLRQFKQLLRIMRTDLLSKAGKNKIILFTSTASGTGKSLLIESLSFSLALIRKRVLIVDTNFRNPSLSAAFNAKPMLEDYLVSSVSFNDAVSRTSVDGVDVLGARGGEYTPFEITGEIVLRQKLEEAAANYDFVFLEGAAINQFSDSKELSEIAQNIIAVFSAHMVIEDADRNSIIFLKYLVDQFIGGILNKAELVNLEQMYGEVAKQRSAGRRFVKRLLRRNLSKGDQ